jgi:hypothetical protein
MKHQLGVIGLACLSQAVFAGTGLADASTATVEQRLQALEKAVREQQQIIQGQQRVIEEQQQKLGMLSPMTLQDIRGAGSTTPSPGNAVQASPDPANTPPGAPQGNAENAPPGNASGGAAPQEPVGVAPEEKRPEIAVISDVGGVLTPKGHLVVEPSIKYAHSTNNNLTFRGIELQETVLIGVIEASDVDRDLISPAITARYGVTRDFEVEVKVPYVYRKDNLTFLVPQAGQPDLQRERKLDGNDIGDVEVAAHYQITDRPPYLVGNLRLTIPTGKGPFDIDRDEQGVDQELATGSGFFSLEPSLTILYPTDPAVLFATLSYQWNVKDDVHEEIGEVEVGEVDPGDSVGVAVGMGFAVNDNFSFSLGYKHSLIFGSTTEITSNQGTRTEKSNKLHLGSLLFGMGYRLTPDVGVNLDMEFGVTEDTPDMQATIRVPISFDLL